MYLWSWLSASRLSGLEDRVKWNSTGVGSFGGAKFRLICLIALISLLDNGDEEKTDGDFFITDRTTFLGSTKRRSSFANRELNALNYILTGLSY